MDEIGHVNEIFRAISLAPLQTS